MRKKVFCGVNCAAGCVILFCVSSCASTSIQNNFDPSIFLQREYSEENINGIFPNAIYIKTRTQTFNTYHYYILVEGLIWYKSIDNAKEPQSWTLFEPLFKPEKNGHSGNKTRSIIEISADADELVALSSEGAFYRYCFDITIAHPSNIWLSKQGWPKEEQLYLDKRTMKNKAWALGKRNAQVLYYEDAFGNQHHNGTMEIATTYMLLDDGKEIAYSDTGLPSDFSRNFAGPERGAFKAASLSASASTMFVINEAGEMYTRIADFDIIGANPMFFKYTYTPRKYNLQGNDFFSNYNEWALPPEDWRKQPVIPLAGNAAISRRITILQNGEGNAARELRVAGRGENGESGFWTKAIFADAWGFTPAPLFLIENDFLQGNGGENNQAERSGSLEQSYSGFWWNNGKKENGFEYEIPNFNILEGVCDFNITFRGETCVLKLHPIEMWTYLKRAYIPGREGPPKLFFAAVEIPENAFNGLSEYFVSLVKNKFEKNDKAFFKYIITASSHFIIMQNADDANAKEQTSALFLTDGTLPDYFPEFRRTWYIADYDEIRRYISPELGVSKNPGWIFRDASEKTANSLYDKELIPNSFLRWLRKPLKTEVFRGSQLTVNDASITKNELERKIELNKAFLAELKARVSSLQDDKLSAILLDMIYIPLHYTVRFSPLRFVDAPKIRTMTSYGDKIVLLNSNYIWMISDTRIFVIKKIIELLKIRIRCYEESAEQISEMTDLVSIPAWYSETITGYWDIADLPRKITGTFFTPNGEIPAALQFYTGEENGEFLGWYLSINENAGFTFFLDPKNSAETIYKRHGKTPEQRRFTKALKINCALYVNPGRTAWLEQYIIENSIKQFSRDGKSGIDVSITYNGNVFEISKGGKLIFQGQRFFDAADAAADAASYSVTDNIIPFAQNFALNVSAKYGLLSFIPESSPQYKSENPWALGLGLRYKSISANIFLPSFYAFDNNPFENFNAQISSYFDSFYYEAFCKRYMNFTAQETNVDLSVFSAGFQSGWLTNGKNHSLSAVYDLDSRQLSSSGSAILGFGLFYTSIQSDAQNISRYKNQHLFYFGPNFGYSYTFIFAKNFFLNMKLITGIDAGLNINESKWLFIPLVMPKIAFGYHGGAWSINVAAGCDYTAILYDMNNLGHLLPATMTLTFSKRI